MVRRAIIVLSDDLEGGPADETVQFGVGGITYEIDLSAGNAERFREALAPFVGAARRGGDARVRRPAAGGQDPAAVRAWARSMGIELPARGRIPKHVHASFAEAN